MLRLVTLSFMILIGFSGSAFGGDEKQQDHAVWNKQAREEENQDYCDDGSENCFDFPIWDAPQFNKDEIEISLNDSEKTDLDPEKEESDNGETEVCDIKTNPCEATAWIVCPEFYCDDTCPSPCGYFWVQGDLLFFKPCVGNFLCCRFGSTDTTITTDNGVTSTLIIGNDVAVPYQWDTGFRIGAGAHIGRSCYELAAYWTRFRTHVHGESELTWDLDFDVLDVVGKRKFYGSPCFYWTPFFGVRTFWIQQNLLVNYISTTTESNMTTETSAIDNNFQRLTATGPVAGIGADWDLACGFGLYAFADAAVVYGEEQVFADEVETSSTSNDVTTVRSNRNLCSCIFAADAGIGISLKKCLCDDIFLTLRIGYEFQRYFNYNMINGFGDLSLNGGSFSAKLSY